MVSINSNSIREGANAWFRERQKSWKESLSSLSILWMATAFGVGILLQHYLQWQQLFWVTSASLFGTGVFGSRLARKTSFQLMETILWLGLIASLGGWHHAGWERLKKSDPLIDMATDRWTPIVFEGMVDRVPKWRPQLLTFRSSQSQSDGEEFGNWQTILGLQMLQVRDGRTWKPASGVVTCTANGYFRDLHPGDRIRVYGKWQRIPHAANPGQFDLADHYGLRGQSVRVRTDHVEQIERIGTERWLRLDRWLSLLMERGDKAIHRHVGLQGARIVSALTLGQREQVDWEMQESLLATGTMHLLAISGLHVEMLAAGIVALALFLHLPRRVMLLGVAIFVFGYAIMCGSQPPVARAAILVSVSCLGRWFGVRPNTLNTLGLAALLLMVNRSTVLFDPGAHLSFLAVATLIVAGRIDNRKEMDPIEKLIRESLPAWRQLLYRTWWKVLWAMRTSAWVWLLTAPLIVTKFHVISPITIVLNVLLAPAIFGILMCGMGMMMLGTWMPGIGPVLGAIASICQVYCSFLIRTGEALPFGHWWLPSPGMGWLVGFYLVALFMSLIGWATQRFRWRFAVVLCSWLAAGVLPILIGPQGPWSKGTSTAKHGLRVTFLDVGHGTCVMIQTPSNQTWLYDAGRLGDNERSYTNVVGSLWYEGLTRVDRVFLSHADSDHFNALFGIADRFRIREFISTRDVFEHESPLIRNMLDKLRRQRVRMETWHQGSEIFEDGIRVRAIHPPRERVPGNDNANSLCLIIEYAGRVIFLPGDLEGKGTDRVLLQPRIHADVFMAPHHGSLASNPAKLTEWAKPDIVVISGGDRAQQGSILETYTSDQFRTWITARDHAIRVAIESDGRLTVYNWHTNAWRKDISVE